MAARTGSEWAQHFQLWGDGVRDEIIRALEEIGGTELWDSYESVCETTTVATLPTAYFDGVSFAYAAAVGAFAAAADHLLDAAFRQEMEDTHHKRSPEEQRKLEEAVDQVMRDYDIPVGGGTGEARSVMDWYGELNKVLKDGYKLRPKNHRILNHTNAKETIEMLMKGEAGMGTITSNDYPSMSYEAAKALYDSHIAADRGTRQSLPLAFMSWLWEQGVKAANPQELGEPNALYELLKKHIPDVDWSKWLNKIFEGNPVPEGSTLGEAMLKLYESGALNERVFWTSDYGAAWGGAKRRAIIAATMELSVEFFAFVEGARLGHVDLTGDIMSIGSQYKTWRDQPKYVEMRVVAQVTASSSGIAKAFYKRDFINLNFFALGMAAKHMWVAPRVQDEHTRRLIKFSQDDINQARLRFMEQTGIDLPYSTGILAMPDQTLDDRLHAAGCQSTRVRVLAAHHPDLVEPLVALYEKLSPRAEKDMAFQPLFDAICETWYLSEVTDDGKALEQLNRDLSRISKL